MVSSHYLPPSLTTLIALAPTLRKDYKRGNPERLKLITVIEVVTQVIVKVRAAKAIPDDELHIITQGLWFCMADIIDNTYWTNPEYRRILFFDKGTMTSTLIKKKLNISETNPVSEVYKIQCLTKFFNFFFTDRYEEQLSKIKVEHSPKIDMERGLMRQLVINTLRISLKKIKTEVEKINTAIPLEKADKADLQKFHEHFKTLQKQAENNAYFSFLVKSPSVTHFFNSQLASAIGGIMETKEIKNQKTISYEQTVFRGIRLYILYAIDQEYSLRGKSPLYTVAQDFLNVTNYRYLSKEIQCEYLGALKCLLNESGVMQKIADYGREHFGEENLLVNMHAHLHLINEQIDTFIHNLNQNSQVSKGSLPYYTAIIGGLFFAPLGYAAGNLLGYTTNKTPSASRVKEKLSLGINKANNLMGEKSNGYFSSVVSDLYMEEFLKRFFSQTLQFALLGVGAALGGLGGLLAKTIYKVVRSGLEQFIEFSKEIKNPELIKNYIGIIQTLLEMPEEAYKKENKEHIQKMSGCLLDELCQPDTSVKLSR